MDNELNLAIKSIAETRAGKVFLWALLEQCNLYGRSFTGNSHTFYNEGIREVGLRLLEMLEQADPTIYPSLLLEHIKQEATDV